MRARVVWSPRAVQRAAEAAQFIAAENPRAAAEWARGLFDAVRALTQFPELGRIVPEVGRDDLREILFGEYRVIYRVAPRIVEVLTVRHAKRKFSPREVEGGRVKRPTRGEVR